MLLDQRVPLERAFGVPVPPGDEGRREGEIREIELVLRI
jgi:hypothetical protein